MKIGIITYWDSRDNYGQLLQCYALQKKLRLDGHNAFVIRFHPMKSKRMLYKFSPLNVFRYIKYKLSQRNISEECIRDFSAFRGFISWSPKEYLGLRALSEENWNDVDAFICGSDQIWSEKGVEQLQAYYLNFVPFQKLKISYAPSFGACKLSSEYKNRLPSLIGDLDSISVREDSGISIVEDYGYKASLVCDPTLLLDEHIYTSEFGLSNDKKDSAFCYFINWETNCDEEYLKTFCKERNLRPLLFATRGYKSTLPLNYNQNPQEWMSQLKSSKISLVNSFHGLVFSMIFHVPFAVYLLKGKNAAMNARIFSILNIVGLSDRIVSDKNNLDKIFNRAIDWGRVDRALAGLRVRSIDFLQNSLLHKTNHKRCYKICFITSGSVHHFYGGLDRVTECLADQFEDDGNKVYYLSFKNRGKYDKSRQHFFPKSDTINESSNQNFLSQFIIDNDIDVIINQEANVNLCVDFKRNNKVKVISCLHFNPNYIDNRHFFRKFANNPILKTLFYIPLINNSCLSYLRSCLGDNYRQNLAWCDKFVLLSSRFMPVINSLTKDVKYISKLESINNPLPMSVYDDTNLSKDKIILFVGRLDNNFKRIDELIDDVSSVLHSHPSWRFVICGDGPDREKLEDYARKKNKNIEFTGYCDPAHWYSRASIIVLKSSSAEGWGMVLTEAMARGVVPVVAGTYSSLPDIITNGVDGLISTDNSDSFCRSILKLINNPSELQNMSKSALQKSKRFNVKDIAEQWYKLFEAGSIN